MAIKTMSASTGGDSKFSVGWHELTIGKAEYGVWESGDKTRNYIDLWFEDYPDNSNLRIYEAVNKTTNEEFKIANVFKYANAGILGLLKDPTGKKPIIQFDDEASGLVGNKLNVYFYKEKKTGKGYTRLFDDIAPTTFVGEHLSFDETKVNAIKYGVEARFAKVEARNGSAPAESSDEEIPF